MWKIILLDLNQENDKNMFLKSIPIFIKQFLVRCNFLLNNDTLNLPESSLKKDNEKSFIIQINNSFKYFAAALVAFSAPNSLYNFSIIYTAEFNGC